MAADALAPSRAGSSVATILHIDGLAQDCSISSAYALEIQQSCIKLSI